MTTFVQVTTAIGSKEEAEKLASLIIGSRLAACAQISSPIQSLYWWKGNIETAEEWRIAFKTEQRLYAELEALIKSRHPYEVPEILAIPILGGNPAYFQWLSTELKEE